MNSDIENVKGTRDILPEEVVLWNKLEITIRKIMEVYNYREVRLPTFEYTELFKKSTGEDTDVVQKEMYTFEDQGGRSLTLKPEGTPSVVRQFIQYGLQNRGIYQKFFYIERMFRQEKPQKGRYREFRQFGAEAIGSDSPQTDAELVKSAMDIFKALNINGIELNINSIGCPECRKIFVKKLREYLKPELGNLCDDCNRRFETNPMRILDCKIDGDKLEDAPTPLDFLCKSCAGHFREFREYLETSGITYKVDRRMVRGLDYYTRTVFEFRHPGLGAQDEVGGGGRYDELIEFLGGDSIPASGYAVGMDRMILLLEESSDYRNIDIFIVTFGKKSDTMGWKLLSQLRGSGFSADKDTLNRSIKAQFREADRQNATWTIIIGEEEINKGTVQLRKMDSGEQIEIPMDIEKIKEGMKC